MMKEESPCTCGNYINDTNDSSTPSVYSDNFQDFDASFVHLSYPKTAQPQQYKQSPRSSSLLLSSSSSSSSCKTRVCNDNDSNSSSSNTDYSLFNHTLLRSHQYMSSLIKVTEDSLLSHKDKKDNDNDGEETEDVAVLDNTQCLCHDCIQRVIKAIDENSQQLELETHAYIQAVEQEEDKQRRLHKALSINAGIQKSNVPSNTSNTTTHKDVPTNTITEKELLKSTIQSFQNEIASIRQSCNDYQNELHNLNQLLHEQSIVSSSLSQQQQNVLSQYNQLEYSSNVFNDVQYHLIQQCYKAENEISLLNNVNLCLVLFDITIFHTKANQQDQHHHHDHSDNDYNFMPLYPLINNLRLAHRPKGDDIQWGEINVAWSQALQLVLYMSSYVKFISRNYRIIPLMQCAKIVEVVNPTTSAGGGRGERKEIHHHLGVDLNSIDKKTHSTDHIIDSIVVFYKLFYQLYVHVQKIVEMDDEFLCMPFEMKQDRIGIYTLHCINENDEKSWRGAINCIASNLKWLSTLL